MKTKACTTILAVIAVMPLSVVGALAQTEPQPGAQKPMQQDMSKMDMDPYFSTLNYPVPQDTLMVMLLSDFQSARSTNDFVTAMGMVQYGITPRWTVGFMAEGQNISGLPTTYGGLRINSYFRIFPHDRLLNFTIYGEYEGLNGAALYKMEVAGFGGGDLNEPLALARRTPVRTFELRAIMYHDWGRVNLTFNFINETALDSGENDFGYAWGVFRQAAYMAMETDKDMAGMAGMPKEASASGVIASTAGLWARDDRGARQHASVRLRLATPAALCGSCVQLFRIEALDRSPRAGIWTLRRKRSVYAANGGRIFDRPPSTSAITDSVSDDAGLALSRRS